MWFLKKLRKKNSIIRRFLGKFRKKSNLKSESQIRKRRRELYGIRENWIENGEKDVSPLDAVIAEFDWILLEEKKQQDSSSELRKLKKQIKELEEKNRKLQVAVDISRRD